MTAVPRKLSSSLEGALAGGGDPATSPLYVFGPFLTLIVPAGVAAITFGASVWLVVVTIATVSAMYRLVMAWVTDGSGGSGLSEEEFGSPAVKLNAGITFVEYTLTFAVSIAALVTFIADRAPVLNTSVLGVQYRTFVAVGFSVLTGWLVNRGPRATARAFGPATAGVLILLWVMVIRTVVKLGLRLPQLDLRAFSAGRIGYTLGGFARILAVMTGIEVFANLVPAYEGTDTEKSRRAFGSLVIIMGTTSIAMLVVGPAILDLSNPLDPHVSVFTQTMDQLLPQAIAVLGTIVGVAVLLSASAASALGLQNLFVGLRLRHYLPPRLGRLNRFGVADRPVWIEVSVVSLCFVLLGTQEGTYLAVYAAGVFILLSMTGWAASKRLARQLRDGATRRTVALLVGTTAASLLTSAATVIIFSERFADGVWTYFVFLPILYLLLGYFRRRLGAPSAIEERVGTVVERGVIMTAPDVLHRLDAERERARLLVPIEGHSFGERALPMAGTLASAFNDSIVLLAVTKDDEAPALEAAAASMRAGGLDVWTATRDGPVLDAICDVAHHEDIGLIVMSMHGRSSAKRWLLGSMTERVLRQSRRPVLAVPALAEPAEHLDVGRIVVSLDGSHDSERVLPFATSFARRLGSSLVLVHGTPETAGELVRDRMARYLRRLAVQLEQQGVTISERVETDEAAGAILGAADREEADMIMLATNGRGAVERLLLGSITESVIRRARVPVLLVPILEGEHPYEGAALGLGPTEP